METKDFLDNQLGKVRILEFSKVLRNFLSCGFGYFTFSVMMKIVLSLLKYFRSFNAFIVDYKDRFGNFAKFNKEDFLLFESKKIK